MSSNMYQLKGNTLYIFNEKNPESKEKEKLIVFLENEDDLISNLKAILLEYTNTHNSPSERNKIRRLIENRVLGTYQKAFNKKNILDDKEFYKVEKKLYAEFKDLGKQMYADIDKLITDKLNKKVIGGEEMFKTLKEAKSFTAHLDALADEIQSLSGVSEEMKTHLAYRLDRLSDVIEKNAFEKEANGVGEGAWLYDQDEARYMSTMGGTGVLEGDDDEARYMSQFKGDDHREVLERKEPAEIKNGGPKKLQPSDNYDEEAVARRLKAAVRKVLNS